MHRYKVDAVVTVIIQTREQLERLKEIEATLEEISIDASDDEKKLILKEIDLLYKTIRSLTSDDKGN
jgi:BMFP domain-containing protein YqiC